MKKINHSTNLLNIRSSILGQLYTHGGRVPSLLTVLKMVRVKQILNAELNAI